MAKAGKHILNELNKGIKPEEVQKERYLIDVYKKAKNEVKKTQQWEFIRGRDF